LNILNYDLKKYQGLYISRQCLQRNDVFSLIPTKIDITVIYKTIDI